MTDLHKLPDPTSEPISPGTTATLPIQPEDLSDAEAYAALKARRAERQKKKMRKRLIVGGILGGIIVIGLVATFFMSRQSNVDGPIEPIVDYVYQGMYSTEISADGSLKAKSSTVISPVDGTIESLNVVEGQTVAEGEVLLTIKNDELDQAVIDAQYALEDAQDELNAAWYTYQESGDSTDEKAYNLAIRKRDSAKAALEQAQEAADSRTVRAPHAGSIVDLNAQVGATVAGGVVASSDGSNSKSVMQISDLSQMRVTVQVDEQDIAKVAVGQKATVTFSAFSDLVQEGNVASIASIASTSGEYYYGGGSGAQFDVEILIPSPDARLKPGMTASVTIITEEYSDVIMVPTMALKTDDGENYYVDLETDPETHESTRIDVTVYAENDAYAVVGRSAASSTDDLTIAGMNESSLTDGDTLIIYSVEDMSGGVSGASDSSSIALGSSGSSSAVSVIE